jgi:hypothetical protein
MRLFAFVIFVCVMVLATCSAPEPSLLPAEIEAISVSAAVFQSARSELLSTPTRAVRGANLPSAPFESQTSINKEGAL